jgi:hypothetical protein
LDKYCNGKINSTFNSQNKYHCWWNNQTNVSTNHSLEPTIENSTKRTPAIIQYPPVSKEYSKDGFNTVDRDDHDSVDYTVSIRKNK